MCPFSAKVASCDAQMVNNDENDAKQQKFHKIDWLPLI
jgi:hypothetical protein